MSCSGSCVYAPLRGGDGGGVGADASEVNWAPGTLRRVPVGPIPSPAARRLPDVDAIGARAVGRDWV
jgi:hypothetical protein